jgi:hypothetical protein
VVVILITSEGSFTSASSADNLGRANNDQPLHLNQVQRLVALAAWFADGG